MQYKRLSNTHIAFRLNPGEELVSSIETIARKEGVTSAMIQGLGPLTISYWKPIMLMKRNIIIIA